MKTEGPNSEARAIPRSILYTPSLVETKVFGAWRHDADLHLLDLEDSVPPDRKPSARRLCAELLPQVPAHVELAVRINSTRTATGWEDLVMIAGSRRPSVVLMTMVRTADEVDVVRQGLSSGGRCPEIYVTIETIEALRAIDEIATVADGIVLGSADLAATLGVPITWESMLAARQAMALASARTGIACIDTANYSLGDDALLRDETRRAQELGFHGKATVHPQELATINSLLRPDPDDLAKAWRIKQAVADAGGGVAVLDGALVGPPFVRRAHATIALASAWSSRYGSRVGSVG